MCHDGRFATGWEGDLGRPNKSLAVLRYLATTKLSMGPIFSRELRSSPRRSRFHLAKTVYPTGLAVFVATAWLMVTGTQRVLALGDLARFAGVVFQLLSLVQIVVVVFVAAVLAASAVAHEKDRKTLSLLLMTRLHRGELVWGKLLAALVEVLTLLVVGLPIFFFLMLLGGVSVEQILRVHVVAWISACVAGSIGVLFGYWREKTFQSLALTMLIIVIWLGGGEFLAQSGWENSGVGTDFHAWADAWSPVRATLVATSLVDPHHTRSAFSHDPLVRYLFVQAAVFLVISAWTMSRVRIWNSADRLEAPQRAGSWVPGTWETFQRKVSDREYHDEDARLAHLDAQRDKLPAIRTRRVWDNPILWRECVTWAYGRRILFIRVAFLVFAVLMIWLTFRATAPESLRQVRQSAAILPPFVGPVVALLLTSWALINAVAVTSITAERDGRALDLLLATDLTPREFIYGKLGGVASVAGLMIVLPLVVSAVIWWRGAMTTQNAIYLTGAMVTLDVFVAMLGVHCGIRYANSRNAIGVSLGTFFFLSLGVAACIMMIVSFSDSFHMQLVPFVAMILGGGVGLLAALGAGNPSAAMAVAAVVVPFSTFYVITCLLLRQELPAFLVTVGSYGFATAAMLVPALFEFDFAMGRSSVGHETPP